ncbi:MAG: tetratricopeptide repeat protein [Methyloceanibacter sp.]
MWSKPATPRHHPHPYAAVRKRHRRLHRGDQVEARFRARLCNRGLANLQLGHYDEALVDYSIALDCDPKLAYCHLDRGSLYLTWATTRRRSTISPRPWPGNPAIPSA